MNLPQGFELNKIKPPPGFELIGDERKPVSTDSWGIEDTARTTAAVLGGFAAFPLAGVGGYARLMTAGPEEAEKTIEEISAFPFKLLTTERQQQAAKKVGHLIAGPFVTAGKGWAGIAELITTGDLQKAEDVIKGKSLGSNIAVPIADVLGQAVGMAAMGIGGHAFKAGLSKAKTALTAKQLEASLEYVPSVKSLPAPYTGKAFAPPIIRPTIKPTSKEEIARLKAEDLRAEEVLGLEARKVRAKVRLPAGFELVEKPEIPPTGRKILAEEQIKPVPPEVLKDYPELGATPKAVGISEPVTVYQANKAGAPGERPAPIVSGSTVSLKKTRGFPYQETLEVAQAERQVPTAGRAGIAAEPILPEGFELTAEPYKKPALVMPTTERLFEKGPEYKESKLAIRAEADAIEAKLTEDFGDLVEYKIMNMKEQAMLAHQLMDSDYAIAKRMAMGEIKPPGNIREATMYEAVKIRALREGDVQTAYDLATKSTVPTRLSEYGQAIKAADSRLMIDPVADMQDIIKGRKKTVRKTTEKQAIEIERLSKKLEETEKSLAEHIADKERRTQAAAIDEVIQPKKPQLKGQYGAKNKIVVQSEYEKARAELRKQFATQLNIGIDPAILANLSKVGMYHLEAGSRVFATWSGKVVEDVGDWVKPHLKELWEHTKETFNAATVDSFADKISKSVAKDEFPEIGRDAQGLAKHFVSMGVKDRNTLVTAVHGVLKKMLPDITRRETMDAISGYGKYKLLSKEEVMVELRDLKGQMQQVAKLEDLESRRPPLKTGVERRTPSAEERRLIKQVEAAKRKYGIQVVDKETQLKSSLDAIKTRLTNEISDLESQIASRQKIVKDKTSIVYDTEANRLKARRDELKKEFDVIFGKPQMSEAGRIAMAEKAVARSIAEYTRKITEGDLTPKAKQSMLHSEKLEKLRAERTILKDQFQALRDAANPKKTPEQIATQTLKTRLRNDEARLVDKLKNLDFAPKEKRVTLLDPEARLLKAKRDQAKENYDAAAQASGMVTKEEAANLVNLSQVAENGRIAMEQGGDRIAYGAAKVSYLNYVDGLTGADAPIKTLLKNRARGFEITWAENRARAVYEVIQDTLKTIADNSVSMVATLDNSFVGRQGIFAFMTHPTRWWQGAKNSFIDFAKTMGGKNARDALMADIYSRPRYLSGEYQKARIIPKTEEQFPTSLPERVPIAGRVFTASENAFVGSGIRMRLGIYDLLADRQVKNGVDMMTGGQAEALGKMVNSLTARGQWGKKGEPAIVRLILWAPKMLKGYIDVLTMHGLGSGLETSFARRETAKNLFKIVIDVATIMAIANAIKPGSAETNPTSAAFGTIKANNTYFDYTGGAKGLVVLAARLLTGERKSVVTGKTIKYEPGFGKRTRWDAVLDFLANKFNPPASMVRDWLRGYTWGGKKFTWPDAAYRAFTPISMQQAIELGDDPSADEIAGVLADTLGVSAQSYEKKRLTNPYLRETK